MYSYANLAVIAAPCGQVLAWEPSDSEVNRGWTRLRPRRRVPKCTGAEKSVRKVIVCHDMMGGCVPVVFFPITELAASTITAEGRGAACEVPDRSSTVEI
jgi:hypothetical protein